MRNKRCGYRLCRFLPVSLPESALVWQQVVDAPVLGSANAFCLNSLGLENGFSIPLACLNVIKGELMYETIVIERLTQSHYQESVYPSISVRSSRDRKDGSPTCHWRLD